MAEAERKIEMNTQHTDNFANLKTLLTVGCWLLLWRFLLLLTSRRWDDPPCDLTIVAEPYKTQKERKEHSHLLGFHVSISSSLMISHLTSIVVVVVVIVLATGICFSLWLLDTLSILLKAMWQMHIKAYTLILISNSSKRTSLGETTIKKSSIHDYKNKQTWNYIIHSLSLSLMLNE